MTVIRVTNGIAIQKLFEIIIENEQKQRMMYSGKDVNIITDRKFKELAEVREISINKDVYKIKHQEDSNGLEHYVRGINEEKTDIYISNDSIFSFFTKFRSFTHER